MPFREDFLWGAATSAYQIEGAPRTGAKGQSVWDALCRVPGAIADGTTGDSACDSFNRSTEDVALLSQLGADAYRFSISWPRVIPEGVGPIDLSGLDYYDALVDALLGAGIRPFITLFHWDYPLALYHRGGWLNPDSPQWFADYAGAVVERLSDRVSDWMTHNEPQCFVALGHHTGRHAPGIKLPLRDVLLVGHRALLGHGHAVRAMRAAAKQPLNIGWAAVASVRYPATEKPEDIDAARRANYGPEAGDPLWTVNWFGDPIHVGQYPDHFVRALGADMPAIGPRDMETINAPIDFLGLNVYSGQAKRAGADDTIETVPHEPGYAHTSMDWAVAPEALRWGPSFAAERYELPIYITENGMANHDWIMADGAVHDPQRIDFLHRYLTQLEAAADDGADIRGYFHWSLLDNFEWAEGFKKRFGIVHVDFETGKRTPKDSFEWYKQWIAGAKARSHAGVGAGAGNGATR